MAGTDHSAGSGSENRVGQLRVSKDAVHVRRRRLAAVGLVGVLLLGGCGANALLGGGEQDSTATTGAPTAGPAEAMAPVTGDTPDGQDDAETSGQADAGAGSGDETGQEDGAAGEQPGGSEDEAQETQGTQEFDWERDPVAAEHPSDATAMERVDYLTGGLTPKSVMASGHGLAIANNMMYSHTSTVFDTTTREQLAVLSDSVDVSEFGVEGHPGTSQGAPVEAVWTDDGRYAYVSQYTMYGQNFGREGFDNCTVHDGVGPSMLYRFDAHEMAWDQVIKVGAVPKYVALSPDQSTLLVSNWCDATLSIVDTQLGEETGTIAMDAAPRGIVIMPDNNTAYAVAMYADQLYEIDIAEQTSEVIREIGPRPRHLNLTEDGSTLYLTVSGANAIYKIDTASGEIVDQVTPGVEPRSVAMSPDESALYVVNYDEATVSKIRTSDMEVIDRVQVDANPIGIDYDPVTNTVWVACYSGSIYVFDDQDALL
ncbi:YncE family protein [Ornithinimicrobium sufpigmenti]|uniref:YncE family protein n=1 Tax=Ornithinimicrobium sufpigmenti TaxID=2508882 RepID=UPI001035C0ED|nr:MULTISPECIES: YncE family protein [unclassified Ornithinimicrobium]